MFRSSFLPGMRPGILQPQIESGGRAQKRFETHRTANISDAREAFGAKKREPAHCVHSLRAIEQCEPFFRLELYRFHFRPV